MPLTKLTTLETVKDFLEKARRRLNDEEPDYADMDENQDDSPEESYSDFSGENGDAASEWLKENDKQPKYNANESDSDEDPLAGVDPRYLKPKRYTSGMRGKTAQEQADEDVDSQKPGPVKRTTYDKAMPPGRELQPSREELARMREYTRPWEQNARDRSKLEAEAHVNPIKHHQGRLVEARNTSHADRQKAYQEFANSPEFQNADPITQMEMEGKFHEDWNKQNPEHLMNALSAHHEAHKKGSEAMDLYNQAKDEKIRHIGDGGVNPNAMSFEEGLQHVGGSHEDEDSAPSGIQQDKGAAFAAGNKDFINQYMKNYDTKAKKYSNVADLDTYDPGTRADISTVLGEHPALKDPAKKRQVDKFVGKYHPLIGKAARHVLAKLGLTDKANRGEIDPGLLHEAGVHALFQAVNDYDHDHPSKAKFTTHLNRKMHGLMQSALKAQDEVPAALRSGAKKFEQQKRAENAAPVIHTNKEGVTTTIPPPAPKPSVTKIAEAHPQDVQDRLKHVMSAKAPMVRKQTATQPKPPAGPKWNIRHVSESDEGEE